MTPPRSEQINNQPYPSAVAPHREHANHQTGSHAKTPSSQRKAFAENAFLASSRLCVSLVFYFLEVVKPDPLFFPPAKNAASASIPGNCTPLRAKNRQFLRGANPDSQTSEKIDSRQKPKNSCFTAG